MCMHTHKSLQPIPRRRLPPSQPSTLQLTYTLPPPRHSRTSPASPNVRTMRCLLHATVGYVRAHVSAFVGCQSRCTCTYCPARACPLHEHYTTICSTDSKTHLCTRCMGHVFSVRVMHLCVGHLCPWMYNQAGNVHKQSPHTVVIFRKFCSVFVSLLRIDAPSVSIAHYPRARTVMRACARSMPPASGHMGSSNYQLTSEQ